MAQRSAVVGHVRTTPAARQLVRVSHEATIVDVSVYVGNFVTKVRSPGRLETIRHGAVILATGADEHRPTAYLYGEDERVWTQLELEERIARQDEGLARGRSLVMIQCVGCREQAGGTNYCARICCSQAIKNALALKKRSPEIEITILFRDMRTYGFAEEAYRAAADLGVRFVRWEPDGKPEVEAAADGEGVPVLRVTVPDPILGQRLAFDADFVVLSAAVVPAAGSAEIARLFKVAQNPDGFFQEAHVKLRPVDFAVDGVFCCGTNHYPKHLAEAVAQAHGAAGRAAGLLGRDTVTASGAVSEVHEQDCVACGACITACSYGAIGWRETAAGRKAVVNPVLCKGDGLCCAKCPTDAIVLLHFTNEEVFNQIDAALAGPDSWTATSKEQPTRARS
ncbi:MAG: CoB--CoM heterodisulfide reductase iron-sulfur subunit A family protein [Deltaproteobacteria bacterium]|nr:CoB--CoM heterodisulfide reductase iron-sulfur subunit A family protein [Deltaproteobacteria bacterium]